MSRVMMELKIEFDDFMQDLEQLIEETVQNVNYNSYTKEYFSTKEVQEYMGGISKGTLAKMVNLGLKKIVIDRICLYKKADVDDFLEEYRR